MISWNTWICDTDFHKIINLEKEKASNPNGYVIVGNHVWMGAGSILLKGAVVPDGCIVAFGSMINKEFFEPNCLLAGSPAVVKRNKISWAR